MRMQRLVRSRTDFPSGPNSMPQIERELRSPRLVFPSTSATRTYK